MGFLDTFAGLRCKLCSGQFNVFGPWAHTCDSCGESFCSSCMVKVSSYEWNPLDKNFQHLKDVCKPCWEHIFGEYHAKYVSALKGFAEIRAYPRTYQGHVPVTGEGVFMVSKAFRNIDDAKNQLRIMAHMKGMDTVYGVWLEKMGNRSGNYLYSTWVAYGRAGKL